MHFFVHSRQDERWKERNGRKAEDHTKDHGPEGGGFWISEKKQLLEENKHFQKKLSKLNANLQTAKEEIDQLCLPPYFCSGEKAWWSHSCPERIGSWAAEGRGGNQKERWRDCLSSSEPNRNIPVDWRACKRGGRRKPASLQSSKDELNRASKNSSYQMWTPWPCWMTHHLFWNRANWHVMDWRRNSESNWQREKRTTRKSSQREWRASGGSSQSGWKHSRSSLGKESLKQQLSDTEIKSREDLSVLYKSWNKRANQWDAEKIELEEMLLVKRKIWEYKETERKKKFNCLTVWLCT